MKVSCYHKLLRVSAVIIAFVLVFDGGFILPITKQLSDGTIQYLANSSSGITASVQSNETNRISAELSNWERNLNERDVALVEREIQVRDFDTSESQDYSTYILSIILFVLLVLIVLNYVLDWLRTRKMRYENKPV